MAELERLVARYTAVLRDEMGLSVRSVDEATLALETAGLNLLLFLEERDPEYLHLVALFPPPEQEVEPAELSRICNQVTKEAKVAKVVLDEEGDLIVSAEMIVAGTDLMPSSAQLAAILPRTVSAIYNAANKVSMALELHGISRAVYDGETQPEESPTAEDPKHASGKWRQRGQEPSAGDDDGRA